jgi:PBP1b-binding outer membrane lipoprotein LpoB
MKKIFIILASAIFLFGCGNKKTSVSIPTETPKSFELQESDHPEISLTPREDGHMIYLKISKIPTFITKLEYELIYTAVEDKIEIKKGIWDTIKVDKDIISKDLLLGTESCTNGCKYKYDTGVTGGSLNLTLITENGQSATLEKQFTLQKDTKTKKFTITITDELPQTGLDQ